MAIHDGHRDRIRQRYLRDGLDGFEEHEALEMLLYNCIPRKDTNDLAHRLINEFGSLSLVMSATPEQLKKVHGVGDVVANYLPFINDFQRFLFTKRKEADCKALLSLEECGEYLLPRFLGLRNEAVYMVCLDSKCKILGCKFLGEGSVNSASVPIRRIVEQALNMNASTVILAHNHPSGVALPSGEDVQTTRVLATALHAVDILLADHFVFSDAEFISMRISNYFTDEDILSGL